jgi:RHS repeat-associated protein
VTGETPNSLNQLTTRQGGTGQLPIRGTTNEPASSVTVNGNTAIVKGDNTFEGKAAVTAGNNTVTVVATDVNGNPTTKSYNVVVTGSGTKTLVYDANGNVTGDGTRTFEWDPLDRLTAVASGTHRSEFVYNGVGQRVTIVEKDNGTLTSTRNLILVGSAICEERDADGNLTKRYYAQGMQIGSNTYYYTRDHLRSIREVTDSSGVAQVRYDYDPYGRRTKLSGTVDSDFGFAGYYYHSGSGLNLAAYRAYDAELGRWLSRDPIGEMGGVNLYGYVNNSPIAYRDPSGLTARGALIGGAIGGFIGGLGGLILGGLGGTALEPGGGTIGGGYLGEVYGAAGGTALGAWLGDLLTGRTPPNPQILHTEQGPRECPVPPAVPDNPANPPGEDWEWRGKGQPGSSEGSWYNPGTGESLHPDLNHPPPIGPHWDWTDPHGGQWRIPPGGGAPVPK